MFSREIWSTIDLRTYPIIDRYIVVIILISSPTSQFFHPAHSPSTPPHRSIHQTTILLLFFPLFSQRNINWRNVCLFYIVCTLKHCRRLTITYLLLLLILTIYTTYLFNNHSDKILRSFCFFFFLFSFLFFYNFTESKTIAIVLDFSFFFLFFFSIFENFVRLWNK